MDFVSGLVIIDTNDAILPLIWIDINSKKNKELQFVFEICGQNLALKSTKLWIETKITSFETNLWFLGVTNIFWDNSLTINSGNHFIAISYGLILREI